MLDSWLVAPKLELLSIRSIRPTERLVGGDDGRGWSRKEHKHYIESLAKAYLKESAKIPPPLVRAYGDDKQSWIMIENGHHRWRAAKLAGYKRIWVLVEQRRVDALSEN